MLRNTTFILLAVLALFTGCKNANNGQSSLPNPSGAVGDVLVIAPDESWKGEMGQALRDALSEPYPFLPQNEPYFKLTHVNKDAFTATAQRFRNLIVAQVDPSLSKPQLSIRTDVYASAQVVVTLQASSSLALAAFIKDNGARLREIFDQTEKDRYAKMVRDGHEVSLSTAVKDKFGVDIFFPTGYQLRTNKPSFLWISLETNVSSQGLIIFTSKYEGDSSFSMKNLCSATDAFTKQLVPGPSNGSYMVTSMVVAPRVERLSYKGRTWYRMRGFWDVKNDFMGGPFVSYSTYIQEKNEVLTIRAYVYSPKKSKRKLLLQTEALIFNINFNGKKS